ncbi:MAG: amidohydrolase family protein [Desulfobacteraceae bacterium]|nr:amidohydrolase family protein [Desulfobacteraceae bacterium]
MSTLHRGHIFHLTGRPKASEAVEALVEIPDGAILVNEEGVIEWCGHYVDRPTPKGAPVKLVDHTDCFILPGFIDTHIHFPQVNSINAYGGGQLLEWLTACIFPAEARLENEEFALGAAREFCHRLISAGTTTSLVFGSAFPVAQEALFDEYHRRGLRGVIGRGIQTAGPDASKPLMTSEEDAIKLTEEEVERWHPKSDEEARNALVLTAIVPRFSLAVTSRTLAALGELYKDYRSRGVYFTSHLNENNRPADGEVAEVLRRYQVKTYLDTYDGRFLPGSEKGGETLLGRRSVLAHCVHCTDYELKRMAETRTSVAHCPISQQFLGSGTMPWLRTVSSGVNVAVGTDFAGGDSWFIPDVLNAAFKVHINEPDVYGVSLHPAELLHLATVAGARALDLEDRIGNFDPGREADMVVIDPSRWEPLANSLEWSLRADDPVKQLHGRLFTVLMACNEVALAETYVRGRKLND